MRSYREGGWFVGSGFRGEKSGLLYTHYLEIETDEEILRIMPEVRVQAP